MNKILSACIGVVVFATSAMCAEFAAGHPNDLLAEFKAGYTGGVLNVRYATRADESAFNVLKAEHNTQDPKSMPEIGNIFGYQMGRLGLSDAQLASSDPVQTCAWALVLLTEQNMNPETGELQDVLKAALSFGRFPTGVRKIMMDVDGNVLRDDKDEIRYTFGYHEENHVGIIDFCTEIGVLDTNEDRAKRERIDNRGAATYNIVAKIDALSDEQLLEIHDFGVSYARFLSQKAREGDVRCLLPVENTVPYYLGLVARLAQLDWRQMVNVNFTEFERNGFGEFKPGFHSNVYGMPL